MLSQQNTQSFASPFKNTFKDTFLGGADQGRANSVHNPVRHCLLWNRPRRHLPRRQHQVPPPKVRSMLIFFHF